jgi:hypothetical protein
LSPRKDAIDPGLANQLLDTGVLTLACPNLARVSIKVPKIVKGQMSNRAHDQHFWRIADKAATGIEPAWPAWKKSTPLQG